MKCYLSAFLLSLASCVNETAHHEETQQFLLESKEFGRTDFLVASMSVGGQTLEMLVDTGVPTFVIEPQSSVNLDLHYDGFSVFENSDAKPTRVDHVRELNVVLGECQTSCRHTFKRGLVRTSNSVRNMLLDGSINPSQLAWSGCIALDVPSRQVRHYEYEPSNGSSQCPESLLYNDPEITLSHKYVGEITLPNGENGLALFDTGSGRSLISASVLPEDVVYSGTVKLQGYDLNKIVDKVERIQIGIGGTSHFLTEVPVINSEFGSDIRMIVGMDVMSNATVVVGVDLVPHLYLTQ